MPRRRQADGQAAVELVALLPLAVLLLAGAWQLVVAGHTYWAAEAAARAAARAAAVGADADGAARARLPGVAGVRVREEEDGAVRVSVLVPGVLGLPRLGRLQATAYFRRQT